jgi:cytochrome P450
LATHPADRRRLVAQPDLIPTAIEEFLRAYAPVTMAREVAKDTTVNGCPYAKGGQVLLSYPAANRDPEKFDNPDDVIIDRASNPHAAFGLGRHRCLGSNLARLQMTIAITEWLKRFPEFELVSDKKVLWSEGQLYGPKELWLKIM